MYEFFFFAFLTFVWIVLGFFCFAGNLRFVDWISRRRTSSQWRAGLREWKLLGSKSGKPSSVNIIFGQNPELKYLISILINIVFDHFLNPGMSRLAENECLKGKGRPLKYLRNYFLKLLILKCERQVPISDLLFVFWW